MQRYRINHRLIIGLFVGFLVVGISAHFLHAWNISNKADIYRKEAAEKLAEKEYLEAFHLQSNFVKLRPDDDEARIELANIAVDVFEHDLAEASVKDRQGAWGSIENAVRRTGNSQLRRELAKMVLTYQPASRASDAIDMIEELLLDSPGDPELNLLNVQATFRSKDFRRTTKLASDLVGFDLKAKEFSDDKPKVKHPPEIYFMLAQSLMQTSKDEETGLRVVNRMVEENPDSYLAHLNSFAFFSATGEKEKASVALDKAYELEPTDATVLLRKGSIAYRDKNYDEAAMFFQEGIDNHPEIANFYLSLAQIEQARGNVDEALAVVERGLLRFRDREAIMLKLAKVDLLLNSEDYVEIEGTLKEIEAQNIPAIIPILDFHRARVKLKQGDYAIAAKILKRVRPQLINDRNKQAQAGVLLATCYEQLGKRDLARQTYLLVLNDFPKFKPAVQGLMRVEKRLGLATADQDAGLNSLVRATRALPKEEQNWNLVDLKVDKTIEKLGLPELDATLLRFQILLQREELLEAKKLLRAAAATDPENENVRFGEVALAAVDPDQGPAAALKLLDAIIAEQGSSIRSRTQRARLLLNLDLDDESLVQQLLALADGMEEWSKNDKTRLYEVLAIQFQQLGKLDESRQLWGKLTALNPGNLPVRMKLFNLALQQQDEQGMRDAQKAILEIVQDEGDPNYILAEVKRKLAGFARQNVSREEIEKARKLLDKALTERPQWHELHIVYGQLLLTLQKDMDLALAHFEEALKYGRPNPSALVWHVKLLAQFGKSATAIERLELVPKAVRERVLGELEAELLRDVGETEKAYEVAERVASLQKNNAPTQVWFASFAKLAGESEAAVEALNHAIEIDPSQVTYWSQLADVYLKAKDIPSLQKTLRDAQLAVDAEFLPLLVAKQFEYRGQFQIAEDIYQAMYTDDLKELGVSRKIAEFYLFWGRFDAAKQANAYTYINRMLNEAYEGRVAMNNPQVAWARDKAVRQLAGTRDYQQAIKAQRLLESGAQDGELGFADQILLGEMLTSQRDPKSQLKAIRIFKGLHKQGQLQKKQILLLAQLLNRTNDWKGCETLLTNALPDYRDDPQLWSVYIDFLIDRGEYDKAAARLNRFAEMKPNKMAYIDLRARLESERGNSKKLRDLLQSMAPTGSKAVDAEQLKVVLAIAQLATRHKDYELAEQLLRFYVKRVPESTFALIKFLALHGDSEEGVGFMKQLFNNSKDAVLQLATQMLRIRRREIGDRFDETIDEMFSSALREDPDSVLRRTMYAEFLGIKQDYDASIQAYDELLKRGDLSSARRAAISNNLAYLLALQGVRLDQASELIEQAMQILGPIDDMLDSRAIVRMARKEYDLAVEDMTLATSISQEPVKFYHLAKAHFLAGNVQAALKAWEEAQQLGFEKDMLFLLEQVSFEEIENRLKNLRSHNGKL